MSNIDSELNVFLAIDQVNEFYRGSRLSHWPKDMRESDIPLVVLSQLKAKLMSGFDPVIYIQDYENLKSMGIIAKLDQYLEVVASDFGSAKEVFLKNIKYYELNLEKHAKSTSWNNFVSACKDCKLIE